MGRINRTFFFERVSGALFDGRLKSKQEAGLTVMLDYWESKHATRDDRFLAYVLATAHHETDRTWQPIEEYGSDAYLRRKYDVTGDDPQRARRHGNTDAGDGVRYAGRGLVQLTWKNNYAFAGKQLGIDLVEKPELALEPDVSTRIIVEGMLGGWFTGRKLSDYFVGDTAQWTQARRIVNGLDKAELIKSHALGYYAGISYTV